MRSEGKRQSRKRNHCQQGSSDLRSSRKALVDLYKPAPMGYNNEAILWTLAGGPRRRDGRIRIQPLDRRAKDGAFVSNSSHVSRRIRPPLSAIRRGAFGWTFTALAARRHKRARYRLGVLIAQDSRPLEKQNSTSPCAASRSLQVAHTGSCVLPRHDSLDAALCDSASPRTKIFGISFALILVREAQLTSRNVSPYEIFENSKFYSTTSETFSSSA